MNTKLKGAWGEELALKQYKKAGFKPVAMCYTTRFGEIDLIVENKNYIVFAEVKMRKSDNFAKAREFVDQGKIRRVRTTAEIWLGENETEKQPRFDVVEVYAPDGIKTANPVVNIIEDAF